MSKARPVPRETNQTFPNDDRRRRFDNDAETLVYSNMSFLNDLDGIFHDRISVAYGVTRRPDPRIARRIFQALGDARSIAIVGAGIGSYEPHERQVLALEPSAGMRACRGLELPPAIQGYAQALPLASDSVDAALACLTLHHWADWRIGVHELRRVARKRVVIFTYDQSYAKRFWLLRDYLPKLARLDVERFPAIAEQGVAAGDEVWMEPVPIPHDCEDGLLAAYWRRPQAYLDERIRANISTFHLPGAERLLGGLQQLAEDLQTGRWQERYRDILECEELDLGYRLLVTEL